MRIQGQKLKLLYLKEVLEQKTDENHSLTASQLVEELACKGIQAERKSIYDDLAALEEYGCAIESAGRNKGYHLLERDFEFAEIKLMVDAIQSSKFLSESKTYMLLKKLQRLCSEYEAKELRHQVYVTNRVKTENQSIHYNVHALHTAIDNGKKVSFKMQYYTREKVPVFSRKGYTFFVSPYALIYSDDNYYLLGFDDSHQKFQHYRVDRMKEVAVLEEECAGKESFKKLDMSAYEKYTFSMYGLGHGELTPVKMRFSNRMASTVIDKFGHDVVMIPDGPWQFIIKVPISVSPQFFAWVFGLGPCVEILEPEFVRVRMMAMMEKTYERYTGVPRPKPIRKRSRPSDKTNKM